jgi:hypothetical protein
MKTFLIVKVLVLVPIAVAAWYAAAMTWLMCAFSIVLGPLVFAVFGLAAGVTSLAFCLSWAAIASVADLWCACWAARRLA